MRMGRRRRMMKTMRHAADHSISTASATCSAFNGPEKWVIGEVDEGVVDFQGVVNFVRS